MLPVLVVASLRHHPAILSIVRRALNPPGRHNGGNYGRWNFGGSGPNGSPQPVTVGPMGAVVSLPGCGDQALHADTPHIFEHANLPPHYVNLFYPALEQLPLRGGGEEEGECWEFGGDTDVGGTAFVAGSHVLEVCERMTQEGGGGVGDGDGDGEGRRERLARTVRPSLDAGDALLFYCRVLHFGLANWSSSASCGTDHGGGGGAGGGGGGGRRRPLLYVNLTHRWSNDPMNWDDREKLFPELD